VGKYNVASVIGT